MIHITICVCLHKCVHIANHFCAIAKKVHCTSELLKCLFRIIYKLSGKINGTVWKPEEEKKEKPV